MKTAHTAIVGFKSCAIALLAAAVPVFEPGLLATRTGAPPPPDIVVTTTVEPEAALSPANAGTQISFGPVSTT